MVGLIFPEVHVDQAKLFENVAAVVLNGFGADEKRFSD